MPSLQPRTPQGLEGGDLGISRQNRGVPAKGDCQRGEARRQRRGTCPEAPPPVPGRAAPIAATGSFGRMDGLPFLQMVQRKVYWMTHQAPRLIELAEG